MKPSPSESKVAKTVSRSHSSLFSVVCILDEELGGLGWVEKRKEWSHGRSLERGKKRRLKRMPRERRKRRRAAMDSM
ncbi:hypothetical protein IEQ34_004870 [Dendrobium chrysotoxum]|uniref:Uncharacterized protein n=1 Tax=Dendrobium chrysotoxum TaxID=161865 RepID=A0AAV7H8I4_DENCH|nr:hypothetical protein IEQ34_004870 [Dendrobium chrysotoxum]